jgi:glucokinase
VSAAARAVGIDIGGTKIAVGAVDGAGAVAARRTIPTLPEQGFPRALAAMREAVDAVCAEAGWSTRGLLGIGIGCAGPVDPARGTIHNIYTLPTWDGAQVVAPLRDAFAVDVRLENDADAALMGEAFAGGARGGGTVAMLTFGTGVGGAVLMGDSIYRGRDGAHPELGHVMVEPGGPSCYCGSRGCLESIASGTAIGAAGRAKGLADSRAVFAAWQEGQPEASRIVERALRATAAAAWTIAHTFLPGRIVFGGGIMDGHFEEFRRAAQQTLEAATMTGGPVRVARAQLGSEAGLVGAARIALLGAH